ncbi:MAG: hypothetical protein Q8M03_13990 [Legionella sp.]|nr:hypothetical protein [Legionella sp.]
MSPKKIIFLMPHPPTTDFQRKFFVYELIENNFLIEYWDIGSILGYDMVFPSNLKEINYLKIATLKALNAKMKQENNNVAFVIQLTRNLKSLPIYLLLNSGKKKTIFFGRGYLPFISQPKTTLSAFLQRVFSGNKKHLILSLVGSAIFKFLPIIKRHDLTFVAGNLAERLHKADSVKLSKIHHFDIDCSCSDNSRPSELPDNYCVFIDDFLPFHPDFSIQNNARVTAEKYYNALNNFFVEIEKRYDTTVAIAAHPKALYPVNPFGGRRVVFGETSSLVKNSAIVIAHASTAISYAVIYEKPLCLIFSEEIKKIHTHEYNQMKMTAEMLGCSLLNFEKEITIAMNIKVDKEKYETYYTEFLSNQMKDSVSHQIVVDEVSHLLASGDC